jgi:hypothetical protein
MLTEIKKHYHLMNELTPDQTIYSIIRHVSKSGMSRHISFFYIRQSTSLLDNSRYPSIAWI